MTIGWTTATDWRAVHALVTESDNVAARRTGTSAPTRDPASTRRMVEAGSCLVHLHPTDGALATITLSPEPPFDPALARFTPVCLPLYQRRLAVAPHASGRAWWMVQALLHVQDVATTHGADAIRCEINQAMTDVRELLLAAGFVVCPPVGAPDGRGWLEWLVR